MSDKNLLEAFKMLKKAVDIINPSLNSEHQIMQNITWQIEINRTENAKLIAEREILKKDNDRIKEENDALLKSYKQKFKEMEENSIRKLAEVNTEISIKRSELEKLNGDIYKLTQTTLGQEVTKKVK